MSDAGLFVALVPGARYVEGNSLIYQSRALSAVAGPSVGGLLVEALSAASPSPPTRSGCLGSAFFLGRIRPAEPAGAQGTGRGRWAPGPASMLGLTDAGALLACVCVINFFSFMFMALFVLYATRALHVQPGCSAWCWARARSAACSGRCSPGRSRARTGVGQAYLIGCATCIPPRSCSSRWPAGPRLLILGMLLRGRVHGGVAGDDPGHQHRHDHGGRRARPAPVPGHRRLHGHEDRRPARWARWLAGPRARCSGCTPRSGSPPRAGPWASCSCSPRPCRASAWRSREPRGQPVSTGPEVSRSRRPGRT